MNDTSLDPRDWKGGGLATAAHALIIISLVVLFLHFGREILEPLVIAALLAFILAPLIRRLRIWGVWRIPAVVITVAFALVMIAGVGGLLAVQIADLAETLPRYETNLRTKIRELGGASLASTTLDRATGTLRELQEEISRQGGPSTDQSRQTPVPVEVRQPQPRGLEAISRLMQPLLSPLAMTALIILFLFFLLLQREDIRDRILRLAGGADLQRSTAALDDAATRLSRFFLMQTLLNTGFAIVICIGLTIIGVPNPILWGVLAGLMRFVPFIGAFIAAFFPIVLSAAVDPGWSMVAATAALFLITEPIAGQVVEPLLYGQHTGLSPVAIVISSLFWTVLWGPIGLLLATPLTVCLVVLGKHIESLRFVEVLLGDEPALEPDERLYQRILANDANEAADQAEEQLRHMPLSRYYDDVAMYALALAQADAARGKLSLEKQAQIAVVFEEIVEDLDIYDDVPKHKQGEDKADTTEEIPIVSRAQLLDDWQMPYPVLCVAARSSLDEAACHMLAQLLDKRAIGAWVQPWWQAAGAKQLSIDAPNAQLVCISYFGLSSKPAHVRYLLRRLKRAMPQAKYLVCFWMLRQEPHKAEQWRTAVGADFAATSLRDATAICVRESHGGAVEERVEEAETRANAGKPADVAKTDVRSLPA